MFARAFTTAMIALAVTACSDVPSAPQQIPDSPAFATTVTQYHNDVPVLFAYNPCQPEWVKFSGKIHQVVKNRDDGSLEIRSNFANMKGVGLTTGTEYVMQQNADFQLLNPPGPAFSMSWDVNTRVISKGSAENFHAVLSTTFSFPPPAWTYSFTSSCRG